MKEILEKVSEFFPDPKDKSLITKAFDFARKAHEGQKRQGGEPYIYHPLRVAWILSEMNLDKATIAAGILHDTVEDTNKTLLDVKSEFGEEIAFLVDGVTKLGKVRYYDENFKKVENLRKMFLAMAKDIRVVLIKLADRWHNMQTLGATPQEQQRRISLETMEIYAPIAHRLGMGELKGQLEDEAFKYLHPEEYQWLMNAVAKEYETKKNYIKKLEPIIKEVLLRENIKNAEINARLKHHWSLYKKLLKHEMNLDKIHDLVAARITVPTIEDCYATLGVIHKNWKPVPGLIKDYIALPKPNGYQSLHTSVFCLDGQITEIQIRTPQMHARAENGIAAHWAYKEENYANKDYRAPRRKELAWIEQLREWQKEVRGSEDFFESLKIDFFKDRIFVLTPKGEVIDLPEGATPVDFAYQVHTDIGHFCCGAKVNNKIVSLETPLESGDMVEILTQKNKNPSGDWLNFVKTSLAKTKIKESIKKKNMIPVIEKINRSELKIQVKDRVGLIKDISKKIAGQKINIISINSVVRSKFPLIEVALNLKERSRLERLLVELKKIKGVEAISYKYNSSL